jgi:glycerophosphoryl diester phosphodiesterase
MKRKIFISGHRGTRVHAIENTQKAFQFCLENQIDYIEFDVKKTRDNEIIIFHDRMVDHLLDGKGNVEKMPLKEVQALHYRDGQKVQTLDEFFQQVQKRVRPMLEIKSRGISDQVMDLAHKYQYKGEELLIQSFNPRDIVECHTIDPQYDYGLCFGPLGKFFFPRQLIARFFYKNKMEPYPFKWLNLDGPFIYDEIIDEVSKFGKHIILGAMRTDQYLSKLDRWAVEIVNADDPVLIRSKIRDLGYDC